MKTICLSVVFFLAILVLVSCGAAYAGAPVSVKIESITLPQPDNVLAERLPGGAAELAEYIKQIEAALTASLQLPGDLKPATGAIVVAVKPNYRAKSWLMWGEPSLPKGISEAFQDRFNKIRPATVQNGPVAFAILFSVNGGGTPLVTDENPMPLPPEWAEVAKKAKETLLMPDGFLAVVWPDEPAPARSPLTVPDGFELQTLDITHGSILKPKGWFYTFSGNSQSLVWTISKEDPHPGGYKTGLRIQLSPGVSRITKRSAQAVAEEIVAEKRKTETILRECPPEQAGEFMRVCLETKEAVMVSGEKADYRILYTISWSNEKDTLAIMIFGTPYEEWDKYQNIYAQMKNAVLVGKEFRETKRSD